jgi:hypothetical protein
MQNVFFTLLIAKIYTNIGLFFCSTIIQVGYYLYVFQRGEDVRHILELQLF